MDNVYFFRNPGASQIGVSYLENGAEWVSHTVQRPIFTQSSISDVKALSDGSVWVIDGPTLYQFRDGEHLQSVNVSVLDTLESPMGFTSMAFDSDGVWFLHAHWGLYHYDFPTGELLHHPDTFGPTPDYTYLRYERMRMDANGRIWVSRNDHPYQLTEYDVVTGQWRNFSSAIYVLSSSVSEQDRISDMAVSHNNELYSMAYREGNAGQSTHLGILRTGFGPNPDASYRFLGGDLFTDPHDFRRMKFDRAGLHWAYGTRSGHPYLAKISSTGPVDIINAMDAGEWNSLTVRELDFDSRNRAWILTDRGLAVYDPNGFEE